MAKFSTSIGERATKPDGRHLHSQGGREQPEGVHVEFFR